MNAYGSNDNMSEEVMELARVCTNVYMGDMVEVCMSSSMQPGPDS